MDIKDFKTINLCDFSTLSNSTVYFYAVEANKILAQGKEIDADTMMLIDKINTEVERRNIKL